MIVIYPVVFTPLETGGYLVYVPDLKINTHGESLADAILMARDAIGVVGLDINAAIQIGNCAGNLHHPVKRTGRKPQLFKSGTQ